MHWKDLLDRMVCPACHARLALAPAGDAIHCVGCRRIYPVRDDIPVLLVDQAKLPE